MDDPFFLHVIYVTPLPPLSQLISTIELAQLLQTQPYRIKGFLVASFCHLCCLTVTGLWTMWFCWARRPGPIWVNWHR
ncbi:hypothetical protein F5144DRAFT_556037 [Chaetomium tenue]|uniref:Uncharacterized protein n=1 Tax=Chaetomium tenue TaxID=1854479 RepID=A0ACB7PMD4_9PEZI|nr:hypothetical protein F5144DRAFT_556037 [Chaetomium globosum]